MTLNRLERSLQSAGAPSDAEPSVLKRVRIPLGGLALLAILLPVRGMWGAQLLLVVLLLTVPGIILLRTLRLPGRAVASFPVYLPCASLVVLLGSGLAVDLLGPAIGVSAPLRPGPLLIGIELICLTLLAASINAPPTVDIPWRSLAQPVRLAWPLLFPMAAAAGALRLNSGHGSGVAFAAALACVGGLIGTLIYASRLDKTLLAIILYAISLALMWSFSLRSNLVYGFDIATEYSELHATVLTGIWHVGHPGDAYGAMLSVTVLPAELHALSGMSALIVLKVVYPAMGALFPVGVFGLARRVLQRRWAFAAAGLVIAQSAFFQQLPALARQEIAFLLYVSLIAAVLDTRMSRRAHSTLVALLSLAMVVSHYSTAYMAIGVLGLTLVLQWSASWFRPIPRLNLAVAVAFASALAGSFLWYGVVTQSASNAQKFVVTAQAQGLDFLPNQGQGRGVSRLVSSYLEATAQPAMHATKYAELVHQEYAKSKTYIIPLPDANRPKYALRDSSPSLPPVRSALARSALSEAGLIVQQLVNVLGAIGALMMVLWRKAPTITRMFGVISMATLLILAVIRISGTLAVEYNPERAFVQGAVVIAVTLFWIAQLIADRFGENQVTVCGDLRQNFVMTVIAFSLVVLLANATGLVGATLGGGTLMNLSNNGEDFERYNITIPELASAAWLGDKARRSQLVYADRYAQLPLIATSGVPGVLLNDVTPETLDQHGWVYADSTNIVNHRARALFDNAFISYKFPLTFLTANYDVVFTDGSSEVFHR